MGIISKTIKYGAVFFAGMMFYASMCENPHKETQYEVNKPTIEQSIDYKVQEPTIEAKLILKK